MKATLATLLATTLLFSACGGDETDDDAQDRTQGTEVETGATAEEAEKLAEADDALPAAADGQGGQAATGFSLNGFRYCEILITISGDNGSPETEVWGTPGVDPCEDEAWSALDPDVLMVENDASSIHMNGPRYFTVDGTVDTAAGSVGGVGIAAGGEAELRDFGEVSMTLLATVDGDTAESMLYIPELVVRTTTWTFNAGTEVYELTDTDGNTYVMQSYALYEDPDLTADDLPGLGDRLDLPEGWTYGSRTLDDDVVVALAADGAMVLNDELGNSYQRNG